MAPKTLYDVVRPICWRLNMFGHNYGNEKPEGWMRRGYKWALKCMLLYSMWRKLIEDCVWVKSYSTVELSTVILDSLLISSFCLQFFFVKEGEMQEMMRRMKQLLVGKMSQKNLNEQLIPFKVYTAIFVIYFLLNAAGALCYIIDNAQPDGLSFSWDIAFEVIEPLYFLLIQQYPSLICILPGIVACYCRAEMDEAMEELKRIKSPLRRAKAGAKLVEKYQQLYELASDTDRALSTAIYFIKWIFFISFAAVVLTNTIIINENPDVNSDTMIIMTHYVIALILNSLILMYFPLLQYFYLAPSANQMFERMNRAIVDCGSIDDQWLSRDPIARPYLLKMRMEVVERVSHMATEDPPFTLFGAVLDKDISYVVILELIDMCNTLSVHNSCEEKMSPSRIYSDFMRQCFDCDYWYQHTLSHN